MNKTLTRIIVASSMLIALSGCQQQSVNEQPSETEQQPTTIQIDSPQSGAIVTSPINIKGTATLWFFEGEFPIRLEDNQGNILASTQAKPQTDWMTEDPVPFTATLQYEQSPPAGTTGKIIFNKSNPSGMPEMDETYELPVKF